MDKATFIERTDLIHNRIKDLMERHQLSYRNAGLLLLTAMLEESQQSLFRPFPQVAPFDFERFDSLLKENKDK